MPKVRKRHKDIIIAMTGEEASAIIGLIRMVVEGCAPPTVDLEPLHNRIAKPNIARNVRHFTLTTKRRVR